MPNKVIVIEGPTASGKTALGIEIATAVGGEVVGADSMQIYKYMDIGTAKPTAEEMGGVPHHMIDIVSPFENYSVSRYVTEAAEVIADIHARGKMPVIVGGTGLYVQSLLSGRDFSAGGEDASEIRTELSQMYDSLGGEKMLERLAKFDGESAKKLHFNDKKRIVRAFEVYRLTGSPISEHNEKTKAAPARYDAVRLGIFIENRDILYERINRRVDKMLEKGLVSEVQNLLDMGLDGGCTAMQAIGYKEIVSYLRGDIPLHDAVCAIKQGSRRYAKRQLSWLRRYDDINRIICDGEPDLDFIRRSSTKILENFGII